MPMTSQRWAPQDCIQDRYGNKITMIVLHQTEGGFKGAVSWFLTPNHPGHTAAHYVISLGGDIVQCVPDDKACWHAGNYQVNLCSLGIEHEGWTDDGVPPTEIQLQASARIVAILCKKYGIPMDRQHIIGHCEVKGATHTDPGHEWPWDHYMELVLANQ